MSIPGDRTEDQILPISLPPRTARLVILETTLIKSHIDISDPFLVTFQPEYDLNNPKDWPSAQKWAVTNVLSATGFNRIMVSTIMAPCLSEIASELHMNSAESVMALSIYLLATAFGPLIMGPLSEVYGRSNVLNASNIWFLVWNIACGFAQNKETLIATRLLAGFGASSVYALAAGVLSDVWRPEERGRSLGIYLLIPLLGAAAGPIIGGHIIGRTSWRWAFWSTSIFQGVMIVMAYFIFRETYGPTILRKQAEKRRQETGDDRYRTPEETEHKDRAITNILAKALSRPVRLALFHPIVQLAGFLSAIDYGLLYIVLATFSNLWTEHYHQSVEISGLHYIACAGGELLGSQLGGPLIDYLYRRQSARLSLEEDQPEAEPESRLPIMFPMLLVVPVGLLLYGWAAEKLLPWPIVDVGVVIAMFGMQIASMPSQAYIIDVFSEHTSSAMAALQFFRSLTAFLFPLLAPAMYDATGYGWGNSLIAGLFIVLGIPVPLILWKFGKRLRAKAGCIH